MAFRVGGAGEGGRDGPYVITLDEASEGISNVGGKAHNLAVLARAGFRVPEGFVVSAEAHARHVRDRDARGIRSSLDPATPNEMPEELATAIDAAVISLDEGLLAVRSSAVEEDLPSASFAGQYETVLNVRGTEAVRQAILKCWSSASAPRVVAYRMEHGMGRASHMAVLVQRMVDARAAGVAFTADPVTGDRGVTVVAAVRGLGERLVSGEAKPDEWSVRGTEVVCRIAPESAVTRHEVELVADLARRVESLFGGIPQDIEWAIDRNGDLFVLQARPITALPERVTWQAPVRGGWSRNFRLGEWLGDPVSPLFETWGIPKLEGAYWETFHRVIGLRKPDPSYVIVHGWYFTTLDFWPRNPLGFVWLLIRYPPMRRFIAQARASKAIRAGEPWEREWREKAMPRYEAVVREGWARVEEAAPEDLPPLVDQILECAGEHFCWLGALAGGAYRIEAPFAKFYRRHVAARAGTGYQSLLSGFGDPAPGPRGVASLDSAIQGATMKESDAAEAELRKRRIRAQQTREAVAARIRSTLAAHPRRLRRFDRLLAAAQYYARLREEMVASFTAGWPLMRKALSRIGDRLSSEGWIEEAEDLFFLHDGEVREALKADPSDKKSLRTLVETRRATWQRQRRLSPPLSLGKPPPVLGIALKRAGEAMRSRREVRGGLRGLPAGPGRAEGPARIIRDLADSGRVRPGDVLVAPATTPAWTPLFAYVAAVVTDTGSPIAHASLIAREYGIPAVVATSNATVRLRDGETVVVDGDQGIVLLPPKNRVGIGTARV